MHIDTYVHGTPAWWDVATPDVAAAAAFYADLFGWDTPEGPPETGGYRNCTYKGDTVAGMTPMMAPGAPPAWTTYIDVADATATAAAITAAGGTVFVPPMQVLDFGTMAVCADPTGAVFGLWQPGTHTGAQVVNEANACCWNELITHDLDAALAFYATVFGWEASHTGGNGHDYVSCSIDGRPVAGVMPVTDTMPADMPSAWGIYFAVDDCDATVARALQLGGTTIVPATDIAPGRFAMLADPTGAMFYVITMQMPTEV